ncbi:MAG TPA: PAS domain S-box protein [Candidatus Eisenbacteria bacterium]
MIFREKPGAILAYGITVAAVLAAAIGRLLIDPVVGGSVPFITLFPAVVVAAWIGGFGPAFLATVLGFVFSLIYFSPPRFQFHDASRAQEVSLTLYVLVSLTIAGFGEAMWRARRRSQDAAAEQLRSSHLLRITLASIGDAVVTTDDAGRVTYLNHVAEEMTGWTVDEAVGRPLPEVFPILDEATQVSAESLVGRVLRGGNAVPLSGQSLLARKDGTMRPVEESAAPIRNDDGSVVGVVLVFHDIAERRAAEKALRDREQRFRDMANHITPIVWTCDASGRATWVNERWYEYSGTTFDEMTGVTGKDILHPDHRERVRGGLRNAFSEGRHWEDTFPLLGRDDRYRWFLSRAVPIRDDEGRVLQWFGTNTDVTALREMEDALREADRRKDEFLAMLAHELRNPLAPLRNGLEVQRLIPGLPDAAHAAREMMARQLDQMVRIVDDLFDVSRISRGRLELKREPVDLNDVVRGAVETSRPLIDTAGHRLTVTIPPSPVMIDADATRIAQVVANLLNNAARYTPKAGRIDLSVSRDGTNAIIRVTDSGVGIAAGMLPRVFDMFTQIDRDYTESTGGLGIGLTLVKRLVEMHGGWVQAASDGPGKGAEFVVRLPLATVVSPSRSVPGATAGSAGGSGNGRTVLLADDNADAARSLAMLLTLKGHKVHTVGDGQAAVERAAEIMPDVVILDIGMPRMDGHEACRQIRAAASDRPPLLVALTGWGQQEDRNRSEAAGFDVHLVKPVDPSELERLMLDGNARRRSERFLPGPRADTSGGPPTKSVD